MGLPEEQYTFGLPLTLGHEAAGRIVLSSTRVVAVDVSEDKLDLARSVGAHEAVSSTPDAPAESRRITGSAGATLVLDLVGMQPTLDLAMAVAGIGSDVAIIGLGDGLAAARVGFSRVPTTPTSPPRTGVDGAN